MFGATPFGSQTTASSIFGSAPNTTTATFGGFGLNTTPTASSGLGTGFTSFGGFGTPAAGTGTSNLSTLGGTTSTPFGGSTLTPSTGLFGQTNQAAVTNQQKPNAGNSLAEMAMAISNPQIFNDERDTIIAKWNQLQAFWGTGKGFYSQSAMVDFKPDNPFCRFKAVGYSCVPKSRNEDGLVSIMISQSYADVQKVQQQMLDALHKIMGGQPTLSLCVQGLRPAPDNKTELIIYILERPTSGPSRRVPTNDLLTALTQTNIKTQLSSQLKVLSVLPKAGLTPEQLKLYLDTPPAGIDPLLWQQAKLDNPDPESLIPVPMIGFTELNHRLKHQEQQTKLHQNRLDVIAQEFSRHQISHTNMLSKLEEYKHKQLELGHRVLKVIVKQEIGRKLGYAIQADEEYLRTQLEAIQAELNHPTQFKGRLNELLSQMRMQTHSSGGRSDVSYQMDITLQQEIKQLLKQQQQGLQHLISVIKDDSVDLQRIEQGLVGSIRQ